MPRKKQRQSKTAFVLGLPPQLSAKEVTAKAKAAGFTLSEKYVYVIRSKAKVTKQRKPGPRAGRPRLVATGDAIDARFASLALDLGLSRAESMLRSLRAKARAITLEN